MYYTYILYSQSLDRYYIGYTADIAKRLISHNKGSNRFTRKGIPWALVYKKEFISKSEAISYELHIKKMKSKEYIRSLIKVG